VGGGARGSIDRPGASCPALPASPGGRRCARAAQGTLSIGTPARLRPIRPHRLRRAANAPVAGALEFDDHLRAQQQHDRSDLRAEQHHDRVASDPYTSLTCDIVEKYHTNMWRVISQSSAAVMPPTSAWRHDGRPTGITEQIGAIVPGRQGPAVRGRRLVVVLPLP